jgi:hypothetical protein
VEISISDWWHSPDPDVWAPALEQRYWSLLRPENNALDREMEPLDLERLRNFNAREWYDFLRCKYFRWKYTAPHRYASTTKKLGKYVDEDNLGELDKIRQRLLNLHHHDVRARLNTAYEIHGLGPAGASGLLALMYPEIFGTVDQFVVKALWEVTNLPEARALARMKPENLSIADSVLLIGIMQRKAADNNRRSGVANWNPRKIDKVLWTYGRKQPRRSSEVHPDCS